MRRKLIAPMIACLLGGCLEAADLAEEQLVTPEYCTSGDTVRLCAPGEEAREPGTPAATVNK